VEFDKPSTGSNRGFANAYLISKVHGLQGVSIDTVDTANGKQSEIQPPKKMTGASKLPQDNHCSAHNLHMYFNRLFTKKAQTKKNAPSNDGAFPG
jgi:hypothetical protein